MLLFTSFVFLNILDIISTYLVIKNGKGREANVLMKAAMDRVGVLPALFSLKIPVLIFIYFLLNNPYISWVLLGLNLFYIWVIYNNTKIYRS